MLVSPTAWIVLSLSKGTRGEIGSSPILSSFHRDLNLDLFLGGGSRVIQSSASRLLGFLAIYDFYSGYTVLGMLTLFNLEPDILTDGGEASTGSWSFMRGFESSPGSGGPSLKQFILFFFSQVIQSSTRETRLFLGGTNLDIDLFLLRVWRSRMGLHCAENGRCPSSTSLRCLDDSLSDWGSSFDYDLRGLFRVLFGSCYDSSSSDGGRRSHLLTDLDYSGSRSSPLLSCWDHSILHWGAVCPFDHCIGHSRPSNPFFGNFGDLREMDINFYFFLDRRRSNWDNFDLDSFLSHACSRVAHPLHFFSWVHPSMDDWGCYLDSLMS